jgi:hypothetical protein
MKQPDAHPLALRARRGWKKVSSVLGYIFSMASVGHTRPLCDKRLTVACSSWTFLTSGRLRNPCLFSSRQVSKTLFNGRALRRSATLCGTSQSPVFLLNSRHPLVCATPLWLPKGESSAADLDRRSDASSLRCLATWEYHDRSHRVNFNHISGRYRGTPRTL